MQPTVTELLKTFDAHNEGQMFSLITVRAPKAWLNNLSKDIKKEYLPLYNEIPDAPTFELDVTEFRNFGITYRFITDNSLDKPIVKYEKPI